jgi:outer membrane protein insertion porin family
VSSGGGFRVLLLIVALLGVTGTCLGAPAEVKVASIAVTGASRTSQAAVLNTFGLIYGRTYPYKDVRDGLARVYEMGFFDDVRLRLEETPSGEHHLTIDVVERPVIANIQITGNRKIGKGDIREKLELGVGSSLDPRLLHRSVKAVRALYQEKGFYVAQVEPDIAEFGESAVNITLRIDEGVKVKVGKISIEGNRSLSDKAIKKVMETKEKGWFTRKEYNPQIFEEDLGRIVERYKAEGFVRAKVTSHDVELSEDSKIANLTVEVDEGKRIYVSDVDIELVVEGELPGDLSNHRLMLGVELLEGEPYSQTAYENTLENLYSILGEEGFVYAQIDPVQNFEGDSLRLEFKVDPQRAVKVNKIIIQGNQTTFEKVIRRELVIKPGDILRRSLIERSHREIFNLGYFEDVQVGSQVANEMGDIDLVFKIEERQTGIANVGAGYNEEFGLTGFLEFSHNNIGWFRRFPYLGLGKGQTINLRWEFGKLSQIELGYRDPWFRDRPLLVGFDIYDTKREYDTYTDKRDGFGLVVGRRFSLIDYSRVFWRYRLERREIIPDWDKASQLVKRQAGRRSTSSTVVSFARNSVDNLFFPRSGSRTSLTCEWAGGWLGGNTAFQSYILESINFLALPLWQSALVFKARTGVVDELGSKGYIPVYERFRLGGTTTDGVRGYSEREIVPDGNAIDEGGRFMLLGTVEYRIPIVKNRAHLLAFADAGNTWNSVRAARAGFLKRSAGFGFRIEIPMMGQMGLDIGYGFDREDLYGGPSWETHFQFGTAGY